MTTSSKGIAQRNEQEQTADKNGGVKYVLSIGIDKYVYLPPLNNAVKDVETVCDVLKDRYQFENAVFERIFDEQATRGRILEQLESYGNDNLKEEDTLIIYYSGHGHLKGNQGFWVPVDAKKGKLSDFISTSDVISRLEDIKARHILLISDSCFSGAFLNERQHVRDAGLALTELEKIRSRWGLCSGRHNEFVLDGDAGQNSPFARSIIKVLNENKDAKLNIGKLVDEVVKLTYDKSQPQLPIGRELSLNGAAGGQLIFHLRDDVLDWNHLQKKDKPLSRDYDIFLGKHKSSIYLEAARTERDRLYDLEYWLKTDQTRTQRAYEEYIKSAHSPKNYESTARSKKKELVVEEKGAWEKTKSNMRVALEEFIKKSEEGDNQRLAQLWVDALDEERVPERMEMGFFEPDLTTQEKPKPGEANPAKSTAAKMPARRNWWLMGGGGIILIVLAGWLWRAQHGADSAQIVPPSGTVDKPDSQAQKIPAQETTPIAAPPVETAAEEPTTTKPVVKPPQPKVYSLSGKNVPPTDVQKYYQYSAEFSGNKLIVKIAAGKKLDGEEIDATPGSSSGIIGKIKEKSGKYISIEYEPDRQNPNPGDYNLAIIIKKVKKNRNGNVESSGLPGISLNYQIKEQ